MNSPHQYWYHPKVLILTTSIGIVGMIVIAVPMSRRQHMIFRLLVFFVLLLEV
jgi:hypothetical protein